MVGGGKYVRVPTLCPYAPVSLDPGQTHATTVNIGEDVNSGSGKDSPLRITLRLQVNGLSSPTAMTVNLDGTPLGSNSTLPRNRSSSTRIGWTLDSLTMRKPPCQSVT